MALKMVLPQVDLVLECLNPGVLPLGAILIAEMSTPGEKDFASRIDVILQHSPWVPIVLLSDINTIFEDVALHQSQSLLQVKRGLGEPTPTAKQIRAHVAGRLPPTPALFGSYLGRRSAAIQATLIERALGGDRTRHLRRQLQGALLLSPHQWSTILTCINAIAFAAQHNASQSEAASHVRISPKSLSRLCRQRFGMGWHSLANLIAWEAMVEVALSDMTMQAN
jgi:hypothetical protein